MFYFSVLKQKKIQNLTREDEKKPLGKKNIKPILKKVNEGYQIKKNFWSILKKIDEGDKKT